MPCEVGDRDATSPWRAVGRERAHDLVVAQALDRELIGCVAGEQAEGSVELVGREEAEHVRGDALAEPDLDAGMGPAESSEQSRHVQVAGGQERSDPDTPAQNAAELVDLLSCGVHLREHPTRSVGQRLSGLGRRDSPARALEQRRAELLFEPPNLVRQRRLGDVELLRSAREVAVPRHRFHAPELPELHATIVEHDCFDENYVLLRWMPGMHPRRMATTPDPITIELLEEAAGDDAALASRIAELVNEVYETAERGLWRDEATRTTPTEIAELIRAEEIAVAREDGQIVGCLRLHDVSDDTSEFGLLVAAPDRRGAGVGRGGVAVAPPRPRARRLRAIQLELLVPRTWSHPSKEFLKAWYGRRGYRLVRTGSVDAAYPQLAPLLATPCDLEVHEKPLRP